jgi:hypothetical protein
VSSSDNIVSIPAVKHWQLNGWYQQPLEEFGGLSPREYLKGKSLGERRQVGLVGLRKVGVLK